MDDINRMECRGAVDERSEKTCDNHALKVD